MTTNAATPPSASPSSSPPSSSLPAPQARYVLPHFVERTSQGTREYDPYSKLYEERIIFLGAPIDDVTASDIMAQLLCLEAMDSDRDISIYINSPGGSMTAFTAVYDTLRFVKADIQTVCLGQAGAVAALILAAGTPGKRLALPNSRIILQQPVTDVMRGQASDLAIQAQEIIRMRESVEAVLAKHTGRAIDLVHEDIDREKILTAEEAAGYGIIDEIITRR